MPRRPRRKFGPSQKDRLFLACLPDLGTAKKIYDLAQGLKEQHALTSTLVLPQHLHVTLFHLGDWNNLPGAIVDLARRAAEDVASLPFDVSFRRAESFSNRTGVYPLALTGERDWAEWRSLHDALGAALTRHGLGGATKGEFKPHITLTRDERRISPTPVDIISWRVKDFVLIHSLLGKTTHVQLSRWPLGASP